MVSGVWFSWLARGSDPTFRSRMIRIDKDSFEPRAFSILPNPICVENSEVRKLPSHSGLSDLLQAYRAGIFHDTHCFLSSARSCSRLAGTSLSDSYSHDYEALLRSVSKASCSIKPSGPLNSVNRRFASPPNGGVSHELLYVGCGRPLPNLRHVFVCAHKPHLSCQTRSVSLCDSMVASNGKKPLLLPLLPDRQQSKFVSQGMR